MGPQAVRMRIKGLVAKAGITRSVSAHTFRHSCGTHLNDAGCDIRIIQELFGHSRIDTTAKYITLSASRLKQAHAMYHPREQSEQQQEEVA